MTVPGSNLLNMALRLIAPQSFQYYEFVQRQTQSNGQDLSVYDAPANVLGSLQAVPRELFQQFGLDFEKSYVVFYVRQEVVDVERDISGDQINYNNNQYQVLYVTDWFAQDGWVGVMCVRIINAPLVTGITYPAAGNVDTGGQLTFVVSYNQTVTVNGSPVIDLAAISGIINGNASYLTGTGSSSLTFQYTVQSGDTANGLIVSSPVAGFAVFDSTGSIPANSAFVPPSLTGVTLNA